MRTHLLIATAASAILLTGGAALAQSAVPSNDALPAGVATGNATSTDGQPSGQAGSADATAPIAAPSSDSTTVAPAAGAPAERAPAATAGADVVSNGPIPDTRANRAKYGMPMSNAGRMSKAAGN